MIKSLFSQSRTVLSQLFVACALLAAPLQTTVAATLSGQVKEHGSASKVYLYGLFGGLATKQDSSKLGTDGSFKFSAAKGWPRGIYQLELAGTAAKLNLVLANENVQISFAPSTIEAAVFTGSKENEAYKAYMLVKSDFKAKQNAVEAQMQNLLNQAGNEDEKRSQAQVFRAKFDSLQNLEQAFYASTAKKYPGTYVEKVCKALYREHGLAKENFFGKELLADAELTRSDVLFQRLNAYLIAYMAQDIESYRKEISYFGGLYAEESLPGKELLLAGLIDIFRGSGVTMENDQDASNYLIRAMIKQFPKSTYAKRYAATLTPEIGDIAPEIELNNPEGKAMKLSSLKGKVVLLDFWASWCGPCRRENPNVVKAYEKYNPKGFDIFSVSLDQTQDKWVAAIAADKLVWKWHVSDLKGWRSAAAATYKVNAIPAAFLLDKEGRIVAKSLRGPALEAKLEELLGSK